MLRQSSERISQILCSGYGMTAAQVADVIRKRFEWVAVAPDDLPPAVCREIPALAPQGRDQPRLQAQVAPGGRRRHPVARHASAQWMATRDGNELSMVKTNWNLENTKQRLVEAADALRRLSMHGIKPSGLRSQWPDVIHRVEEAYGWTVGRVRPPRPSPAEITRMDEAIECCFGSMPTREKSSGRARCGFPGAASRTWTAVRSELCRISIWRHCNEFRHTAFRPEPTRPLRKFRLVTPA
jgi:hypothetical protein